MALQGLTDNGGLRNALPSSQRFQVGIQSFRDLACDRAHDI